MLSRYHRQLLIYAILLFCRYGFTAGCAAVVGGAAAFKIVHAQSIAQSERDRLLADDFKLQSLEFKVAQLESESDSLLKTINLQENEISKMEGIGIGLGAILMILQVLQAFMARSLGRSTNPNSPTRTQIYT